MLPALRRPPCLVSFSGGLDSSFVLAVAARTARREGLPPPVPCTWRFVGAPRADESAWQERVLDAVPLPDWVVLEADDDLDLVGPVAQQVLARHGLLHPVNVHLHAPILDRAAGGSVLTGVGGDQVLSGWRRPGTQTLRRRVHAAVPRGLRARVRQHRGDDAFPWLSRDASRRVVAALLRERAAEPARFDRRPPWHADRRDLAVSCASLAQLGAAADVLVVNPLVDPVFARVLADGSGHRQVPARSALLAELAAGVLPAEVTAARPKAHFLEVFFRSPTRQLLSQWDGEGLDANLVDLTRLRDAWSRWPVPGGTAPLVQQLWLSVHRPPTPTDRQQGAPT